MKAAISLLAVLLMLSCTSLAQTAPVQDTAPTQLAAPAQETAPAQQAAPTQQAAPAQETVPVQQAAPTQETTAPVQQTAPTQQAAPAQETAPTQLAAPAQETAPTQKAGGEGEAAKPEAARPEAENQASTSTPPPSASAPSTEEAGASVGADLAAPSAPVFAPGAKIFIAPMDGFEQTLAQSILKKKVPVVLVNETAKADFVMSGSAHVKKRGWISGMVLDTGGKGYVSITDVRTGNEVFTHKFKRADSNLTEGWVYQGWADTCASDLKKTMKKEVKQQASSLPQ